MITSILKRIVPGRIQHCRLVRFFPRLSAARKYYRGTTRAILKWGVRSREETNYTYGLTKRNLDYLACTVAAVTGAGVEVAAGYIREAQEDRVLAEHIIEMTRISKFRSFADLRCEFGRRLGWYAFARILKPALIVETGVDKGHGAVLLAAAAKRNRAEGAECKYLGTDINREAGYLLAGEYKQFGEILYGDSIESLEKLTQPIGLFINDSDHSSEYEYREYVTIKNKLDRNAVILGDNSHVSDSLATFSKESKRNFIFFREQPADHWYPGAGIGISY